jgi:hypothetical protein
VPPSIVDREIGRRILKQLALRGLVRHVEQGWVPTPSRTAPAPLEEVGGDETSPPPPQRAPPDRPPRDRRNLPALCCPRCLKTGFVRHENIVKGTLAERHFVCGLCNHWWKVRDVRKRFPPLRRPDADHREYQR